MQLIAERKIREAIEEGQLQIETWRNRPLPMGNDSLVPAELRMAYKILKNGGYLPPEIETRKEIKQLEDMLVACEDEYARVKQIKKLNYLILKLNTMKGDTVNVEGQDEYYRKIIERISIKKLNTE